MKFFNYDIKIKNKPSNIKKLNEIFNYFNVESNIFIKKDEPGDNFYGDTIDHFKEQSDLGLEYLPEVLLHEDFDISKEEYINNSVHFYKYKSFLFIKKLNKLIKKVKTDYLRKKKSKIPDKEDKEKKEKAELIFDYYSFFLKFDYEKNFVKNRRNHMLMRPGVSDSPKKNSLMRNKNFSNLGQIMSIFIKTGNKKTIFKHHNIMYNNFYDMFKGEDNKDLNIKNFIIFKKLFKNIPSIYRNFNYILNKQLPIFNSIFDIKPIKNPVKKNKSDNKKYTYEVTYLKKDKRVRNTLKVIELYNESFKSYFLWERLLFMYLSILINWQNSFLIKRRSYIYSKSIKFFRANIKRKNYS